MRVMLDTNVLISGMIFHGPERRLLETILKNDHVLVLCEQTETEAVMVLLRKFSVSERFLQNFLRLFRVERVLASFIFGQTLLPKGQSLNGFFLRHSGTNNFDNGM